MSKQRSMSPLMEEEFQDLMCQQTSYSALVDWLQQSQQCSYGEACKRINEMLQQYRQRYAAPRALT